MKRIVVGIVLLALIPFAINSQTVDELKVQFESASGLQKAQYALQLSVAFTNDDPSEAKKYAQEALNIGEGVSNSSVICNANAVLAQISLKQKKYAEAYSQSQEAAAIFKDDDPGRYASCIMISADALVGQKKHKEAIESYEIAYTVFLGQGMSKSAGYAATSSGNSYSTLSKHKDAITWYKKAAIEFQNAGRKKEEVKAIMTAGIIYSNYGDYVTAEKELIAALDKSDTYGLSSMSSDIQDKLDVVKQNKEGQDNSTTAYVDDQKKETENYIEGIEFQASKSLAEIEQLSEKMQLVELKIKAQQDEYEKKLLKEKLEKIKAENMLSMEKAISEKLAAELKITEVEAEKHAIESQRLWIVLIATGVILILILVGYFYQQKSNKILQKKNIEIASQRDEIAIQSKNIAHSIDYATKIQTAILPSISNFKQTMKDSFVLLKPKDNVSGDFFWYAMQGENVYVCAADCTGHGVPGAFISIICNSLLDKVILENGESDPERILEKLCQYLTIQLSDRNIGKDGFNDGMDLSLAKINLKSKMLSFAGARNSLYILREKEILELKGVKRSISMMDGRENVAFRKEEIQLFTGDRIFAFSDGFPDQKGGPKGKKFFYGPFKKKLIETGIQSAHDQKKSLEKTFESWKGSREQFDDVLIVGISIP